MRAESNGHVCGVLAGESPEEPRSRRVVLVGALLTAISPLMAQSGRVRIRVTDVTGAVIPGAEATLLGPDDATIRTQMADSVGEITWLDLPFGDSRFTVVANGFKRRPVTVTVSNSDEVKIDLRLEVGEARMGIFLQAIADGRIDVEILPATHDPGPTVMDLPPNRYVPALPLRREKRRHWLIFHW